MNNVVYLEKIHLQINVTHLFERQPKEKLANSKIKSSHSKINISFVN